jgi:hypothetical protein
MIYNFVQTKQAIHQLANECPGIKRYLDESGQAEAGGIIDTEFSDFARLRHSVAHAGLLSSTPKELRENAIVISPSGTTFFSGGSLRGGRYEATVDQRIVSYLVGPETVTHLQRACSAMDRMFHPLAEATYRQYRDMRKAGTWPPSKH